MAESVGGESIGGSWLMWRKYQPRRINIGLVINGVSVAA
jgi:hypothetical protein